MKSFLYGLLFATFIVLEIFAGYSFTQILNHPHPYAFYVGLGYLVILLVFNVEVLREALKQMKEARNEN